MKDFREAFRERVKKFAREARRHYEEGDLELSAFFTEQCLQFLLKLVLLNRTGAFPYTHNLHLLFKEVAKMVPGVEGFYSENVSIVDDIYQAYFSSRYLPIEFDREAVSRMLSFVERVIDLLKEET